MLSIKASWPIIKDFVNSRTVPVQYIDYNGNYFIGAIDGPFSVECLISQEDPTNSDLIDFETNYKTSANSSPNTLVTTQFEAKNKTLKLFCAEADVDESGIATILALVPGTPGSGDGRWINAGEAFFDVPTAGDKITGVWFIDHDNLLGNGIDFIVGSYTDDAASSQNQGWYLPPVRGTVKAETIGFYGFVPSGFYLKIVGKKGNNLTTGKFYVNLEWAIEG